MTDRIRIGVLGDSDSHSYRDVLWMPPGPGVRGGERRAQTLQWTDALARLRPELDLGAFGEYGWSPRVARVASWFGMTLRSPTKQDYEHVFALSGAGCSSLAARWTGQTQHLLHRIARDSAGWRHGVVVIRIGINDLGTEAFLDSVARGDAAALAEARVDACTAAIATATRAIRQQAPTVRVVLVGLADNRHWPPLHAKWQDASATARLVAMLDRYDGALAGLAAADPAIRLFDDRRFFESRWGGRTLDGRAAYHAAAVAGLTVTPTQGDELPHAVLRDGHAGTVVNVLWAQALVALLREAWQVPVAEISDADVARLLRELHGTGLR
ncbi:MAG: GDSL-type esterase/lipase family protein [Gemmatimonadaceae bacterium]|nr:GDSL-type esterase/lipase family protein [Gemmatimonadaceae bacterium]